MLKINKVLISPKYERFLIKRRLLIQYIKVIELLANWNIQSLDLKLRQPKSNWIYSFRINKQYRVFWEIKNNVFYVDTISNHQN